MAITARRSPFGVLILAVLLGVPVLVTATSQAPNFSGTWVEDAAKPAQSAAAANGEGLLGAVVAGKEVTIVHARTLKVTRPQGGKDVVFEFLLDGTPSGNIIQSPGGSVKQMNKAAWVGERIELTTTVSRVPDILVTKQVLSLKDGNLVVETTTPSAKQTATYKRKK